MSFFTGAGLIAAFEDEANNEMTEIAIGEAGADSMEADLVEVVDLAGDVENGAREIESTVKDADQLERHVEVLNATEEEGGASEETIEATEIAVESIYARLGIYSGSGIPALENFQTKHGRASNTRVAIEAITDNIKRIWEAVKLAFQKLVNYVKDFFSKLFDANAKMLSRINALRQKVKDVKGNPDGKVKASGIKGVIAKENLKNARTGAGVGAIGPAMKLASGVLNSVPDAVKGAGSDAAFSAYTLAPSAKAAKSQAPDGMQWTEVVTVGTSTVAILEPKKSVKGEEAFKAAAKCSAKVIKSDAKGEGELDALDKATLGAILDGVEAAVKELMGQKAVIASSQNELDLAVAEIGKLSSSGDKNDKEVGARSTKARTAVTAVGNAGIKSVTLTGSEITRVCQAYLTYVERSLSTYTDSKDKKDKKDKKDPDVTVVKGSWEK